MCNWTSNWCDRPGLCVASRNVWNLKEFGLRRLGDRKKCYLWNQEKSSTASLLQGTTEFECWSVIMTCITVTGPKIP